MRWIRWIDTLVAVFVVALVVIARMPASVSAVTLPTVNASATCGKVACGSGFNQSNHDFVNGPLANTTVNLNGTNTTVGQCTLCHTPHSALLTTLLWNHHLSNNSQFSWDVNTTMAGTPFTVFQNNWTGSTTKCLSCHDGSVSRQTINWFMGQTPLPGSNTAVCTTSGTPPVTRCVASGSHIGNGGNMADVHPVVMPYPCGRVQNTYGPSASQTGAAFVANEWVSQPPAPIEIYTNPSGNNVNRQTQGACTGTTNGIECGSCHDVHNGIGAVYDMDLLRGNINPAGATGYICQLCHAK